MAECALARQTEHTVPGRFVRSSILSGAAEKLRDAGKQPASLARKAGLPAAALTDPDLLVAAADVIDFFEIAAASTAQRNWALELSLGARLGAVIGPLWLLLRSATTVRQMCADFANHFDLYTSAAIMRFESLGRDGVLHWSAATGQARSEVQMAEYALSVTLTEIRAQGPRGWTPPSVRFRHEAPEDLRLHRQVFGPNLRFNSDDNAIELDAQILDAPLAGGAPRIRALVHQVLRHDEDQPSPPVTFQVQALVRALLPYGPCSVGDVSRGMGLSVRTLQARLQASGHSFRAIKDAARADLAEKYLKHSDMTATQVADLLGYADLTSLSRSFRRWHDATIRTERHRRVRTTQGHHD